VVAEAAEVREHEGPYVLAIDMGTSSTRAIVFDSMGQQLPHTESQIPYELSTTPDGGAVLDPEQVRDLTARVIDEALQHARSGRLTIELAAVSCFWHSLIGLDRHGDPVTPIYTLGDTRCRAHASALRSSIDVEAYRQETGVTIHSSYWPAKLRWLQASEPDLVARVERWTSAADYLMRAWLGLDQTAEAMATGTGLLSVVTGDWSESAVDLAQIDRSTLPPIISRRTPAPGLSTEWAERWPELAEIPWFPPVGDGACANVGSGATSNQRMALTVGTTGAVRGIVSAPVGEAFAVPDGLWAYRLDPERLVIGAAISNGGSVPAWISNLTGLEIGDASLGDQLAAEPDAHGLTVLPFLSGERAPLWSDSVSGVIAGVTLTTRPETLMRAGLESVSLRLALLYRLLAPHMAQPHAVVANGGALLGSPAWQRITCDALGAPLTILAPTDETAARGAAVLALEASGLISDLAAAADPVSDRPVLDPDLAAHNRYHVAGERQQRLLDAMLSSGLWAD
jgi:gluconokinase